MATTRRPGRIAPPSLSSVLLLAMLATLWIAGGGSRADVSGQVIVRTVAVLALVAAILFGRMPERHGVLPVAGLLLAAAALPLVQLVPLSPGLWQALPGRALFVEAATVTGQPQPWRPLAIVPAGTLNAAASLLIPAAVLLLLAQLREDERAWLPGVLLAVITASTVAGLLQFSGMGSNNPLINDSVGQVSGTFANRNHLALFLALGCLLAPVWAFRGGRRPGWRAPVALALVLLFALVILATGSRAGLVLGALGLAAGPLLVRAEIARALRRYPRWVVPALGAAILAVVIALILMSVAADRAVSINRALAVDPGQDMRGRALPTVLSMIAIYFPAGAGLGGFDPLFRIHEPFALLKTTYFNHAHNDWLEVVLDGGLLGLLLLLAAVAWWAWASVRAWRTAGATLARLGSVMLLLVMLASLFDYPARTPMMMATMVIAALWLARGERSALLYPR
jgi:O-antigen ligase